MNLLRILPTVGLCWFLVASSAAGDDNLTDQLNTAAQRAAGETYTLEYRFSAGETVRYRVTHLVTVDTTIEGTRQRAKTRSVSTKEWQVQEVGVDGRITFAHVVADVDMWQKVDRRDEIRYNSRTDDEPPPAYEKVAESVGKPLAVVTIDPNGRLLKRESNKSTGSWGGQLLAPMPGKAVKVGDRWHKPLEIAVRQDSGQVKRLKTRQQYELKSVDDGVATITMTTQLLTPLNDPKIKVQIVQRLTSGEMQFDIERGRVIGQQFELDETIIGFNGAKSIMNYLGRFSEELIPPDTTHTAAKPPRDSTKK